MLVTLVNDPADVDMNPAVMPWLRRLSYAHPVELLDEYRDSNLDMGSDLDCPAINYLAEHLDDDIIDVEAALYRNPDYGAAVLCESIARTVRFNNQDTHEHGDFIAGWAQQYLLIHLMKFHTFAQARPHFERLLGYWQTKWAAPEAQHLALAYFSAGHPNPRRFFERHPVALGKFPGLDPSTLLAPDFPPGAP